MPSTPDNPSMEKAPAPGDQTVHHVPRRKKEDKVEPSNMQLNLTSMIDVIFQLLIYFVITASFAIGEGVIAARMPEQGSGVAEQTEPPKKPVKILITAAGATSYRLTLEGASGQQPANFSQLMDILKSVHVRNGGFYEEDHPLVIQPEGQVRWQHVVNAFNATVAARFKDVSFAAAKN
ncbi:MAG: biopolymer transporter ExbD [Phycisphaeraceae bacterium]|nr:biopolymer transporter ExbD [Phycisphaeraceae bacterium]